MVSGDALAFPGRAANVPPEARPALQLAHERTAALLARLNDPRLDAVAAILPRVFMASEFAAHLCEAEPGFLRDLVVSGDVTRAYSPGTYTALAEQCCVGDADEAELLRALRRLRNREMLRIAWRDLVGWADLDETLGDLSDLADACLTVALSRLARRHAERYGIARDAAGHPQSLVVLGMGKLGAHELNFSSDIDLMLAFPEEGESDGVRPLASTEYFTRLAQRLIRTLDEKTADGFVFRVDMRLRPFGDSGPLVMTFGAMEAYYQTHGREWERYALIKARPVAGDLAQGERLLRQLRPFVYRRYLDYGVFESLRDMKERIAREVERKGLEDNIKLGRGGIREIEFIGQSFQLIRGGREPRLQERGIRRVLDLLGEAGYLPRDDVAALKAAYVFLRRLENRLQMRSDAQTHDLPQDPVERARLAAAMGFSDTATFDAELARHRGRVQQIFDGVFIGPRHAKVSAARASGLDAVWRGGEEEEARRALAAQGYPDAEATLALLKSFRAAPSSRLLSEQGRRRLDELVPAMVRAAAATSTPHATLERLLRIVEAVGRRTTYLSLLVETPAALEHLARVCAASSWVAELVARRPLLLDELIDPRVFQTAPALEGYATELAAALARADAGDGEARMEALAEFQQASIMRVAAADIGGVLPLMKVSDHLTAIAEHVVRAVLEIARAELEARHGRPHRDGREARFAVVGYGKLGGYELGYGSDLDLVFLHDVESSTDMTDGPKPVEAGVYFARLAQRILNLLTLPTASGPLYRVDTRLRPAGAKGLPVTSLAAFERYQREEAWTWEHQALLRARAIAGDGSLCADFERARRRVLAVPRDAETLRCDVRDMRARMRREHVRQASRGFDIKHDPGGITDIEFLVQYWVLREAHRHPDLLAWPDVIRFLEGLARHRIISETDAALLSTSYRTLRARVHALSLQGREAVVEAEAFAEERQGVLRLWQEVFGGSDEPEGNDQSREGHRPL